MLCSHLFLEYGAQVRFSLGTNVNAPFYQVSMPEFGHSVSARSQPCIQTLKQIILHIG